MTTQEERKKKVTAALATAGINIVVFLILFFAAAWQTAGSGEGEFPGIEVNLGYDDQGSGNIQPNEPVGTPEATDVDHAPATESQEAIQDDVKPSTPAVAEETKPETSETVTDPNSDVEIREEKKDVKPEKPVEKAPEKPVVAEEKKVDEKPTVDTKAVYKPKSSNTTAGDGEGKQGTPGNQGDDEGKTGDKGVPGGIEGAAVYKGKPGGGDGGTLDINGWNWDFIPKPALQNETGRIVFIIKVNQAGEVIDVDKESGSLSAAAEQECRNAIEKLTFTKKPNANVPSVSVGRITFVARAQ